MVALAAGGSDPALLASQAIDFGVPVIAVARGTSAQDVQLALYAEAQRRGYQHGDFSLPRIIGPHAEQVRRAATSCSTRSQAPLTAADLGAGQRSDIGARQQESLIIGPLVLAAAKPGQIVPVDSEHCPAQCLRGGRESEVRKLVLTASGGPFLGRTEKSSQM